MKFILLVSSLLVDSPSQSVAEATQEYGSKAACVQAVEIRTGQSMAPVRGGMKLTVNLDTRYGAGRTVFVCSPYGGGDE